MTHTLSHIVREAIDELKGWRDEHPREDEPHDTIFEIADNSVPTMNADLLRLAAENLHLATDEPELGPANGSNFDGSPSPINIIAANIFEHVESALWEAWREMEDETEDEEDDE